MHYAFQEKEYMYIVMDYKEGGDLRYHMNKKDAKFTEDQISNNNILICRILYIMFDYRVRILTP